MSTVRSALRARYGSEILRALEAPILPFPLNDPAHGQGIREAPILERVAGDHTIRYRRDTLARGLSFRPDAISQHHRDAITALDEVLDDTRLNVAYSLTPGTSC